MTISAAASASVYSVKSFGPFPDCNIFFYCVCVRMLTWDRSCSVLSFHTRPSSCICTAYRSLSTCSWATDSINYTHTHTHTHTHTQKIRRTFRTNTDTNMPQFQQHTPEPREPLTGAFPPGGAEPAAAQMEDPTDWRTAGAMRRGISHHRNSITSTVHV